jgi:ribonuclease BN (tRNA processing enzyme)
MAMSLRVTFLGAGDAFSSGGLGMAAYLVQGRDATMLLDCGATALMALKRQGLDAAPIDAVLLSHLHGDHFAGLPFLFLEYVYNHPRRRPLVIAGPPGTEERVQAVFAAMYKELAKRPMPFEVVYREFEPEQPVDIAGWRVLPFRVPHQENEVSLALRLEADGRTLLYSGDSGWTEAFVGHSHGVDLFICECCYFETRLDFHLDYPCIAANRARFGCRRLVLTHLGPEVLARLDEVHEQVAEDGLVIEV